MFSSQAHPPPNRARGRAGLPVAAPLALALVGATLAACSGDTARTLALDAGYGPKVVAAPDFVTASRRETPDYMNVGVDAPKRTVRAKSAEGQKALEAELEGARGRNETRGRAAESAGKGTGKGTGKAAKPAPPESH